MRRDGRGGGRYVVWTLNFTKQPRLKRKSCQEGENCQCPLRKTVKKQLLCGGPKAPLITSNIFIQPEVITLVSSERSVVFSKSQEFAEPARSSLASVPNVLRPQRRCSGTGEPHDI